jgi:hypothetical protein
MSCNIHKTHRALPISSRNQCYANHKQVGPRNWPQPSPACLRAVTMRGCGGESETGRLVSLRTILQCSPGTAGHRTDRRDGGQGATCLQPECPCRAEPVVRRAPTCNEATRSWIAGHEEAAWKRLCRHPSTLTRSLVGASSCRNWRAKVLLGVQTAPLASLPGPFQTRTGLLQPTGPASRWATRGQRGIQPVASGRLSLLPAGSVRPTRSTLL